MLTKSARDIIKMSDRDYQKISTFIYNHYGIKLSITKKTLVESRLYKRLRITGLSDFGRYVEYLFSPLGISNELVHMVNALTTNKTDFFREADHFDFLSRTVLPELQTKKVRSFKIWSAACSTGQEPYTLAMVLNEYKQRKNEIDFSILGTDLSTDVLSDAVTAVYPEHQIECIPNELKARYFLRSRNREERKVRIISALREKVTYQRLNLMDEYYNLSDNYHIVFCRNVLIYFDRKTQENVINKIATKLQKGGYFFIGHSESLAQMQIPLEQVKPTVFRKI